MLSLVLGLEGTQNGVCETTGRLSSEYLREIIFVYLLHMLLLN